MSNFKEKLKILSEPIPSDSISLRVQSARNGRTQLLVYKDARVDINYLNRAFGQGGWKRSHRRDPITNALYCILSVYNPEINEWVSIEDVGTPSNMEKDKGEVSDAMKRAGFNLGIGIQLYDFPPISIKREVKFIFGWTTSYGVFTDGGKVCYVVIRNANGEPMFTWVHPKFDKTKPETFKSM